MEWVEVTAKTVDEAKERALDQLGVDEAEAEFEVLEEPKPGLFGRVRGEARVKARIAPRAPRPKQERQRKKSDGESKGRRKRQDGGSGVGQSSDERRSAPKERSDKNQSRKERTMMEAAEQESVVTEFFEGLSEAIGLETTVSANLDDENILKIDVDGSEVGLLIGPGLHTLDALQEIARHVVQRAADDREYGKVVVDVAGVRESRREALAKFVTATAEQARDEDRSIPFEPMSSSDRKIVHDTIGELDGVVSTSEGEEPRRRVVVRPA